MYPYLGITKTNILNVDPDPDYHEFLAHSFGVSLCKLEKQVIKILNVMFFLYCLLITDQNLWLKSSLNVSKAHLGMSSHFEHVRVW